MNIPKETANKILSNLDRSAERIEKLASGGHIDPRLASSLVQQLDAFSDRFEVASFGVKNLQARQAKVLKQDADESYMKSFENPNKVIEADSDEEYMHKVGPGAYGGGVDTFDQDNSSNVEDRQEPAGIRDLSEYGDFKRQPTQKAAPKGKPGW